MRRLSDAIASMSRPGDAIFLLGLALWLAVSVGPPWVLALLFAVGTATNLTHGYYQRRRAERLIREMQTEAEKVLQPLRDAMQRHLLQALRNRQNINPTSERGH